MELTQQLSDDDKLELSRALAVETRGIKLKRLLNAFKTDEISLSRNEKGFIAKWNWDKVTAVLHLMWTVAASSSLVYVNLAR